MNFLIDQRKLQDAVVAVEDFILSTKNANGTPFPIPSYVTRDYLTELMASIVTKLRTYGENAARLEGVEIVNHTFVSEEGSPFKKVN